MTEQDARDKWVQQANERATRGALWLDANTKGWAHEINIEGLDMAQGTQSLWAPFDKKRGCILCQLSPLYNATHRTYTAGRERVGLDRALAVSHGFIASDVDNSLSYYDLLTEAWAVMVRERQTTAATTT